MGFTRWLNLAKRLLGSAKRTATTISSLESPPEWEHLPGGWPKQKAESNGWNVESVAETQLQKWPSFVEAIEGTGPLGVSHEGPSDGGRRNQWAHNLIMSYAYVLAL